MEEATKEQIFAAKKKWNRMFWINFGLCCINLVGLYIVRTWFGVLLVSMLLFLSWFAARMEKGLNDLIEHKGWNNGC